MIVALYKTWRGNEFVVPSIESIYPYVDKILFVHSDVSWQGEEGNDVAPVVEEWHRRNDAFGKIVWKTGEWRDQQSQYDYGIDMIQKVWSPDFILLIDTDEVWAAKDIKALLGYARTDSRFKAYACRMFTYIKEPTYRIWPQEPCRPVVLVRGDIERLAGVRGNTTWPRCNLDNIHMHHFSYVRRTWEDVRTKIVTSHIGDKLRHRDLDLWKKEVWDNLPNVRNFHTTVGFEHCWQNVVKVDKNELPSAMKGIEHETCLV